MNNNNQQLVIQKLRKCILEEDYESLKEKLNQDQLKINESINQFSQENVDTFIQTLQKFIKQQKLFKELKQQTQNFESKIKKIMMRNKYDENEVSRNQIVIDNIQNSISIMNQSKQQMQQLKKAIQFLNQDKIMACIRIVTHIKEKSADNNYINKVYNQVWPQISQKIKQKINIKIDDWIQFSLEFQQQLGLNIFKQNEANFTYKRKQSQGMFQKSDKFLHSSFLCSRIESQLVQQVETHQQIDFHSLNQCYQILNLQNEGAIFEEIMIKKRNQVLISEIESYTIKNYYDMHTLLSKIIGFLVVSQQIAKYFNINLKTEALQLDVVNFLEIQQYNVNMPFNEVVPVKNQLLLFESILFEYNYGTFSTQISNVVKKNYQKITDLIIENDIQEFENVFLNDPFLTIEIKNYEQFQYIQKVFQINDYEYKESMVFPKFMIDFTKQVKSFIELNNQYFEGIVILKEKLHNQVDKYYSKLNISFQKITSSSDILMIAQKVQMIDMLLKSIEYFNNQLQNELGIESFQKYKSPQYLMQERMKLTEQIQEDFKDKIGIFLENYQNYQFMPDQPNSSYNPFIEDMMNYLRSVESALKSISKDIVHSLVYLTLKYINDEIYSLLEQNEYNKNMLCNIQKDLIYIFKICGTYFVDYPNIIECLWSLRQFTDLFLVGKPVDLLDKEKRSKYNLLNIHKILPILENYRKKNVASYFSSKIYLKTTIDKLKIEYQIKQ